MTFSSGGGNALALQSIQSQLQQLLSQTKFRPGTTTGVNATWSDNLTFFENNAWHNRFTSTTVGVQNNGFWSSHLETGTDFSFRAGALVAAANTTFLSFSLPITGKFLYRQYFNNKTGETLAVRGLCNMREFVQSFETHTNNPVRSLFFREWILDTEGATTIQVRWEKLSGTAELAIGMFQLIPIE